MLTGGYDESWSQALRTAVRRRSGMLTRETGSPAGEERRSEALQIPAKAPYLGIVRVNHARQPFDASASGGRPLPVEPADERARSIALSEASQAILGTRDVERLPEVI